MSQSENRVCECNELRQMRQDNILWQHTATDLGWLFTLRHEPGTGHPLNNQMMEYTNIRFCPFCGREIALNR